MQGKSTDTCCNMDKPWNYYVTYNSVVKGHIPIVYSSGNGWRQAKLEMGSRAGDNGGKQGWLLMSMRLLFRIIKMLKISAVAMQPLNNTKIMNYMC